MSLLSTPKQFKCILFDFVIFIILYKVTGADFLGTARLLLDCGGGNFGTLSRLVGSVRIQIRGRKIPSLLLSLSHGTGGLSVISSNFSQPIGHRIYCRMVR
jgi:hypothetical protein